MATERDPIIPRYARIPAWNVLVGRILLAYLFVPEGLGKLMNPGQTLGTSPLVGAAIEIGFGLALLFGTWPRGTGIVLALFSVASAFQIHSFWDLADAQRLVQKALFDRDLATAGGLLVLASIDPKAHGRSIAALH